MEIFSSRKGFTAIEMVVAIGIVAILAIIYFAMVDSYRDRRMNEQAAKVLMQAAKAQEDFFAKEHQYFDADVSGNGEGTVLKTPGGHQTSVRVPTDVTLRIKAQGPEKREFVGYAS
jgi:prepilin-type N-terminal cleavage/methylation domain-containing protein